MLVEENLYKLFGEEFNLDNACEWKLSVRKANGKLPKMEGTKKDYRSLKIIVEEYSNGSRKEESKKWY